jgi:hypothetical protein
MTSRILTLLGTAILPSAAFANPGHIADTGHGHSHWLLYLLLAGVLFGLAVWARTYLNER